PPAPSAPPDRRRGRHFARAALLALGCAWLAGCTPAGEARPPDLVLVTIDTLRPDHLSVYGYARPTTPSLERWFPPEASAVYERAYSAEAATSPSVVSFLSGLLPQDHGVRLLHQLLPDATQLVPDLLPAAYESAGFVSNAVLAREAIGMADRFDHYDDFVDELEPVRKVFERNAARTTDAVLAWVGARADPARPLFLWVHYIDPHGPYAPPDDWPRRYAHDAPVEINPRRVNPYMRLPDVRDGLVYVDRYDEEITYADREVGRLLDGLDAALGLDDALVVFTADHGESMMEHENWFTHGYHVYDEVVRVPLLVRGAGVVPGRTRAPSSGIDVAATLLRAAGAELPPALRGADLRRPDALPPGRPILVEASDGQRQVRAIVQGGRKVVAAVSPAGEVQGIGLFDLEADPGETTWQPAVTAPRLQATLLEMIRRDPDPGGIPAELAAGRRPSAPRVAPGVEGEELEKLRALGYAE
ncbi:MAG: sulfatase, partial [Myxococcales bacterium]|nr:sulfatase [Myxococcales bacterium]